MRSIASDDFYELRLMAKLGEAGFASLTDLYLPLIGANALGLYLALYAEAEEGEALATHEALFLKTGLTPGQFGNALAPLEAVGLIRTFQHQAPEKHNIYSYCVYAPSSPSFFLDDILFAGALAKALGEAAFTKIKSKYALPALPTDGKEVSVSFKEYFNPDLDEPVFAQSRFAAVGDGPAKLALSFSEPAFLSRLAENGYSGPLLGEAEIEFVAKIGDLYGYDSSTLADFAIGCFVFTKKLGEKLDRQKFLKRCREGLTLGYLRKTGKTEAKSDVRGDNAMAKKIRMMDAYPAPRWLQILQGGHKPANADLKLLETLQLDMGLSQGATNALIDYILQTNNNVLSAALAEKIAAELVRSGVMTARDAMEYLLDGRRAKNKAKKGATSEGPIQAQQPVAAGTTKEEKTEISDEELDALFDEVYKK